MSVHPHRRATIAGLCAVGLAAGTAAAGFDAENVSLYSHLDLATLGGSDFAEDCWGYVSPSGREYALIGLSVGTGFVEITDPANPVIVEIVETENRGRDMTVFGHYVFTSSDSGPLHIIDVDDIDNGVVTLLQTIPKGATHNLRVNAASSTLYLAIGGPLVAVDISAPEAPVLAGIWEGQCHDVQVVTYDEGKYAGREIAFVFAGSAGTLDIVDVTDKKNMFLVGQGFYPNAAYTHQGWLSEDRRYIYLNDELDDIPRTSLFNVEDLTNPVYVGDFSSGLPSTDHNLYVRDGFIFEANYTSGLRVFDTCDPENPVQTGFFDTFMPDDDPGFDGAWSNYPFFPSGTVIVSDRSNGLFVLDVTDALGGCDDCSSDLDDSGAVDFGDILEILAAWGNPGGPEDLDDSGTVDFGDILIVLAEWGPCA